MGTRRTGIGPPASFFSFQDIMMCCLGIMVLIAATIALMLRPMQVVPQTASSSSSEYATKQAREEELRIAELQSLLSTAEQLANRDLDAEIAELQRQFGKEADSTKDSVSRLERLIEVVRERRRSMERDPAAEEVAMLLDKRDQKLQALRDLESRRRLTFLPRKGTRPTRAFEVAAGRIVTAMAVGQGGAAMTTFDSPVDGQRWLLEKIKDTNRAGQTALIALKPSGIEVWELLIKALQADGNKLDWGMELIPEDRWITDDYPCAGVESHG